MNSLNTFIVRCAEALMGTRRLLQRLGASVLAGCAVLAMGGCARDKAADLASPTGPAPAAAHKPPPVSQGSLARALGEQPVSHAALKLAAPERPRNWDDARQQAAHRLVAANPGLTYTGKPPDILLAIPVLTVELHADGSVRQIKVMRYPSQARDTVNMAVAAVRRAAPFGDVSRLPKPWRFNETFLFNAERKFKPLTLDRV